MATIELHGDQAIEIDLREFPAKVTRATVRALNRAIGSGRTFMVREVARDTGILSRAVRDAMVMREASANHLVASLAARLKRIPLIDFKAKGPEPSRGRGRGVTYRLPSGKGRIETAFIAIMKSGHRGVYRRKGTARLGIVELKGPSLGHVFAKYRALGLARALEVFQTNFDHELDFVKTEGAPGAGAD